MKKFLIGLVAALFAGIVGLNVQNAVAGEAQPLNAASSLGSAGATYFASIKFSDITTTNTAAGQILTNGAFAANKAVKCVGLGVVKPFKSSDTNLTSLSIQLGDSVAAGTWLPATECAKQATDVLWAYGTSSSKVYTAANVVKWTFSTSVTNVINASTITQGEIRAYFQVIDAANLP